MIIINILLFATLCVVLFLLWQTKKFRRPTRATTSTMPGTQPSQPSQPWWGLRQQSLVIGLLLIGLLCVLFPQQVKDLQKTPLIAVALVLAIVILSVRGNPEGLIKKGHSVATIVLVVILGYFIFYPAVEKQIPKSWFTEKTAKSSSPQTKVPAPQDAEVACITVTVPADTIVKTGFKTKPMQRVYLYRVYGGSDDPNLPSYYIRDRLRDSPIYSDEENVSFSDSDNIWLKGGPMDTKVTISRKKL